MPDYKNPVTVPGISVLKAAVFLFLSLGILLSGLPAQEEDEEEAVVFKGVGIHVRLGGGYSLLSGGDFKTGIQGMYDWGARRIVSAGYTLGRSEEHPLDSGYEFGGDIVYYFAGRLGIGAGGTLARVNKINKQLFKFGNSPLDYAMTVVPHTDILALRLSLFYEVPLNRLLTVCLNAGPAYYSVNHKCQGSIPMPDYGYDLSQSVKAGNLGVQGGIGLEIRMNQRLAFILEAQARYAKISGFDGKEGLYEYLGGPFTTSEKKALFTMWRKKGFPAWRCFLKPRPRASIAARRSSIFRASASGPA